MIFDLWLAFIAASFLVTILPGPSMLVVIADAISTSRRASVITALGVVTADGVLLALSLFGVGTILEASAVAFTTLKWVGVAYLLYLGVNQLLAIHSVPSIVEVKNQSARSFFSRGFFVNIINPKIIGFFLAFFPQFVSAESSVPGQLVVLGVTFLTIVFIVLSGYIFLADLLKTTLRTLQAGKLFGRTAGMTLIGAAVLAAAMNRQ